MKLYLHQEEAVEEVLADLAFGGKNVTIEAPTSFGKSLVISELAKRLDGKIIILINITALIDQIAEHLDEIGQSYSILKAGRPKDFNKEEKIQIVMSQTYYARRKKLELHADYIIQDERHKEFDTDRTKAIMDDLKPKAIIGLTATPYDQSGFALPGTDIISTISVQDLEDKGYLCPVKYFVPKFSEKLDFSSVKKTGNDYSISDLEKITNKEDFYKSVIEVMNKRDAKNHKGVVFCSSIEAADRMAKFMREDGFYAESYHSKADFAEEKMDAFKTNTDRCIVNKTDEEEHLFSDKIHQTKEDPVKWIVAVSKINIGFSVKDISMMVSMRPTQVLSLFRQIIGRGVRTHPSKKYTEFIDCAQNTSTHGFHTDPYTPPIRTGDNAVDAKAMSEATKDLNMKQLGLVLDDELEPILRASYVSKLEELKQSLNIPLEKMNPQQLMDTLNLSEDHKEIITCITYFYEKLHGPNIMPWGAEKPYVPSDYWGTSTSGKNEHFHVHYTMDEYFEMAPDEMKPRWIKALKTRCKNICKEKQGLYRITGFIKFMFDKWESDNTSIIEYRKEEYKIPEIDIDIDEIPFNFILSIATAYPLLNSLI